MAAQPMAHGLTTIVAHDLAGTIFEKGAQLGGPVLMPWRRSSTGGSTACDECSLVGENVQDIAGGRRCIGVENSAGEEECTEGMGLSMSLSVSSTSCSGARFQQSGKTPPESSFTREKSF
ncbi:hypothetical protein CEXT_352231 [Caerostris extrusa]|uniref:Uncharacterized protein n=1 Tax=Caerostris extrusa TaxID=172846 RepID=A0AAV4WI24_CAEEX|nr:hypothetical protein CEXT_352231 [Caerostris extrusa]